jgi:dipeptide transport system permease protein
MIKFILRRLLLTIPTFVALMFVTFIAIRLVPGDPVEVRTGEHGISPERLAYFRHEPQALLACTGQYPQLTLHTCDT